MPQSWVDGLRDALEPVPGLSLAIATPGSRCFATFDDHGTTYYDIRGDAPATGVRGVAERWRGALSPATTPAATLAAARDIAELVRPDIVHVHGTENPYGLLAAQIRPTPTVVSLQGILVAYERLYFAGRSPADIARLVATREFLKGRGAVHGWLWMRHAAEREVRVMSEASAFIGRTDWDRSVLAGVNPQADYYHCDEVIRAALLRDRLGRRRAHRRDRLLDLERHDLEGRRKPHGGGRHRRAARRQGLARAHRRRAPRDRARRLLPARRPTLGRR